MGIFKLSIISISITSLSVAAGERIKHGMTGNVETDGFLAQLSLLTLSIK